MKNDVPLQNPLARRKLASTYFMDLSEGFEEAIWEASDGHPGDIDDRREARFAMMMGGPL